ncbi:hypothetical protein VSS74_21630 [Conexibacter stalactiti]|uniref:Uncharacterized protein n=1 Tax=Conexibacter stalactiti TaxID=1940611 RepID=A0ABU4HUJ2_9ACTN|nr:hypothetical protein [Conexibacter stalactiti]MDW5596963.1 hypothetical protein [Conexibacter stalactiti]MEC5037605.1 hypothetical protein [Conexibacter stalactiti]
MKSMLATAVVLAAAAVPATAVAAAPGSAAAAPVAVAAAPAALSPLPAALAAPPLATAASNTASGYAPLGDVSRDYAFSAQETNATAVDQPGRRAALIGALGLGAVGDTALRAGGSGALTITLSRQVDRATVVRGTRLVVRIPAAYRVRGVHAPGWECAPVRGRTLRCAAIGATQAGGHGAVRVGLLARRAGRASVRVSASWREGRSSSRPRTATAVERFTVRRPLGVALSTSKARVLGDGAGVDSPPIVLTARLRRYDAGLPVDYRWQQLCGARPCERVDWQTPTSGRAAGRVLTAQVRAPTVDRATRLRFALTARDWRGETRGVATVVVLPHRAATLKPGARRLRVAERADGAVRLYASRARVIRALDVSGSALAGPRAGQRVALHVDPQGGELERVRWSVVRGPRAALQGRTVSDRTLAFVVPRGVRSFVIGVRAVVSGRVVRTRETIHVVGPTRRAASRRAASRRATSRRGRASAAAAGGTAGIAPGASAAQDEAASPFCQLWNDTAAGTATDAIVLSDGARVTLGGATAAGADCADNGARIAFSTTQVRVGDLVFADVAGSVTPAGLTFTSGWLDLPDGWWSDLPPRLRVEPDGVGSFAAPLGDDGRWGPLRAQIGLDDGVELLPLPEGWTFPAGESTLAYVPAERRFALRSVAQAPAGQDGRVTLDGSVTLDGATSVTVGAERLVVLHGVDDRTVALSGSGTLQTDPDAAVQRPAAPADGDDDARTGDGDADARASSPRARAAHTPSGGDGTLTGSLTLRSDPADGEIALTSNVFVKGMSAQWDSEGIALATDVRVATGRDDFEAHASGEFASTSQWKLTIAQTRAFSLGDGVTLDEVAGTFERAPYEGDDDAREGSHDTFTVSLTGAVHGWSPSDALTGVSVRGAITNACTAEETGCSTRQVRLAMEVRGDAHVYDQTVPWYGIAAVNLSTFAVRFEGGAQLAGFGPEQLRLTDVRLKLTTDGPDWCRPAGGATASADAPPAPADPAPTTLAGDQELAFGVSARGRLLGESFTADGEFARSGYCLTGSFGEFTPDGLPAGRGSRPMVDEVRFAYASKAADVVVAGRAIRLGAGDVRLSGALNLPRERLPESLRDALGVRADLSLALTRSTDGYGLSGTAAVRFARPIYVIGSSARADETRLGLTSTEMSFDYSGATSLRLELAAKAALETPANSARGVAASRTPLFLAAGINLGAPSVNLSAGVDTSDPSLRDGTVRDAFGQQGLDVRRLLVSASVGADTSFGIAADATLPDGWSSSLGMPARTPAKVTFSISQTNACLELEVGQLPAVLGGPGGSRPVLTLGPLSANWAQIVVAPTGCTIGNPSPGKPGYKIEPGFALGFDGSVGPTPVTFAASMRKHGTADFAVRGTVRVGAFDAGPVAFRRTALDLDIDTGGANRHVDVAFSGGLDAGESTIDVEGRFSANNSAISALLRGRGRLRFADTTFAEGNVDARLEFVRKDGSWTAKTAEVNARTRIMAAEAGLLLSYRDGAVATAAGAFQYTADVGPLGMRAGALFAYAPDGVRLDGDPRDCSIARLQPQRDGKELMLRLCSAMRLGPLSYDTTMNVSLPQQWDFDFVIPRSEVGVYVASVYMQGELRSSLRIGLSGMNFWVRNGSARAGGCVHMLWWDKCANGVDVAFKPNSGRFEGSFIGIPVSWGSDTWRSSPAPSTPAQEQQPQVGAGDRVFVARADRIAVETRASADAAVRRTVFVPARGGAIPSGAILDPERNEVTVTLPLPGAARSGLARPARAFMLTFAGVAFDGELPRTTVRPLPGGNVPAAAYASADLARVPEAGETVARALERPGLLALTDGGRRLRWNADPADAPALIAAGLPLAIELELAAGRRAESRAALLRARS